MERDSCLVPGTHVAHRPWAFAAFAVVGVDVAVVGVDVGAASAFAVGAVGTVAVGAADTVAAVVVVVVVPGGCTGCGARHPCTDHCIDRCCCGSASLPCLALPCVLGLGLSSSSRSLQQSLLILLFLILSVSVSLSVSFCLVVGIPICRQDGLFNVSFLAGSSGPVRSSPFRSVPFCSVLLRVLALVLILLRFALCCLAANKYLRVPVQGQPRDDVDCWKEVLSLFEPALFGLWSFASSRCPSFSARLFPQQEFWLVEVACQTFRGTHPQQPTQQHPEGHQQREGRRQHRPTNQPTTNQRRQTDEPNLSAVTSLQASR